MIDWGRISRITNFCISRLNTQSVIDAKAEAIKESVKDWYSIYEERNLADPECHYEATLCKYASRYHNAAIDNVAREHERLIRDTPSVMFGKLSFLSQESFGKFRTRGVAILVGHVYFVLTKQGTFIIGVPIDDQMINVYALEVEVW